MNFELLVATNNAHKLHEIRQILAPHRIVVYGMKDLNINIGEVIEDGQNYFENALIKAKALQQVTKMPIIADDSGLEILALNNMPGLHSARFAMHLLMITLHAIGTSARKQSRMRWPNANTSRLAQ